MPTPSAPGPQSPFTFSSTCPDTEESHETQETHESHDSQDTRMDLAEDSLHDSNTAEDHSDPTSTDNSPRSGFDTNDGPARDSETDASSPVAHEHPFADSQKSQDALEIDRTDSPCETSPFEHSHSSRPRQGVGTSSMSACQAETSSAAQSQSSLAQRAALDQEYDLPSMGYGFPSRRITPTSPSSFLRAGSRFTGTQQSERQVYDVQVEIKYVDLRESFLCGYLRIQGLTDDHPTLTTYFEGEIIGNKYGFMTKHENWGANDKTDLSHWSKFPAFRPYSKQARRGSSVVIKDIAQSEHVFMRWKEHFLVPDHRVRTITGASFEGFYYICFNQVHGEVNGIYFHSKSERFQQLELKHVEDRGCFSSLEFR